MKPEEQMELLHHIQEMEFVLIELHLYLDTHPCDQDALDDYNSALEELDGLLCEYTKQFGALLAQGFHGSTHWNWIASPWPWEM